MNEPSAGYRIEQLNRPGVFSDDAELPTVHETHISVVFVTETRAYKFKKPIKFPFLDYSTLDLRKRSCDDEVRLNRRLAPDVYLGVLPVTMEKSGPVLNGNGEIVDYCVEMRRLPEDAFLDQRFRQAAATPEDADRLLDVLLPFYEQAKNPAVDKWGEPDAIWPAIRENLDTLSDKPPAEWSEMLARLRSSQWQFLALHGSLLEARVQDGKVVEGHGDLRPEHVCLLEPPIVYDCVEFSLPFRAADVLSELAFLAMECDFLGAGWFGQRVLSEYRQRSGDDYPDILAAFFKSYRAIVRGKVEFLRSRQQSGAPSAQHLQRAHRYLQLASSYAAQFHEPRMLVMIGASGTGKSHVAREVVSTLGAVVLRTDAIRQELAGGRDPNAELGSGVYSADKTGRTYDELFHRARKLLREGTTVVLDGTFIEESRRATARSVAAEEAVRCLFLYCNCPEKVAIERIEARRKDASDISDARPDIYQHQIRILKQAADLSESDVLHLDTTTSDQAIIQSVTSKLKAMGERTV